MKCNKSKDMLGDARYTVSSLTVLKILWSKSFDSLGEVMSDT